MAGGLGGWSVAGFAWALGELADHVAEVPGPDSNPRIEYYHGFTAGGPSPDQVPWCSSFVCACVELGGDRSPRSKWARSWLAWGAPIDSPRLGCIAVLSRGEPASNQGHVGFVACIRPGKIALVSGNTHDRVSIDWYPVDRVIGYRIAGAEVA